MDYLLHSYHCINYHNFILSQYQYHSLIQSHRGLQLCRCDAPSPTQGCFIPFLSSVIRACEGVVMLLMMDVLFQSYQVSLGHRACKVSFECDVPTTVLVLLYSNKLILISSYSLIQYIIRRRRPILLITIYY